MVLAVVGLQAVSRLPVNENRKTGEDLTSSWSIFVGTNVRSLSFLSSTGVASVDRMRGDGKRGLEVC